MNTDTPETACSDCGSTEDSYFSRIEPMGYFCPDCGHEEGKPVERQCDNQSDKMTNITDTPETDEAGHYRSVAGYEVVLADFARKLERERDEARAEMIRWMSIAEGRGRTDDDERLTTVTAQRDRLAEALKKVVTAWDHAEWLDENDFESFRETLQSLTPKP
jgi:hypothetical protein